MKLLTMAPGVLISFLSFLSLPEVLSHYVLCFLQLLLLLNNFGKLYPPLWGSDISSFRTA